MKFSKYILAVVGISTILLAACAPTNDTPSESEKDTNEVEVIDEGSHEHGGEEHGAEHSSHETNSHTHAEEPVMMAKAEYPLLNCPISGGKLGSMGEPHVEIISGREVRFCCDGCTDKFKANVDEFFEKMDASIIALQSADYPFDYCLVSGDELGGEHGKVIDTVVNNQLFRVCCKDCIKEISDDPMKFLAMLQDSKAGKEVKKPEGSHSKS